MAMPSPFVDSFLKPLALSQPPSPIIPQQHLTHSASADAKGALQSILLSLTSSNKRLSAAFVRDAVRLLNEVGATPNALSIATDADTEEDVLKQAIVNRLVVGLYAESIDLCIALATEADDNAEWWADIERSPRNIFWYLLQTFPVRLFNIGNVIVRTFHTQNLPLRISNLTPASIRQLFPSSGFLGPSILTKAFFPHLNHQPISVSSFALFLSPHRAEMNIFKQAFSSLRTLTRLPLELTQQECIYKRKELEKIRNQRAETLGRLAQLRGSLASVVKDQPWNIQPLVHALASIVSSKTPTTAYSPKDVSSKGSNTSEALSGLLHLSTTIFISQKTSHKDLLDSRDLRRPSRLTLIWPRLLLLPPICIFVLRSAYTSRASLVEMARDARATIEGFIKGWLIEPLKDVLHTVRAGREDGVIVRKEGVSADFESLERMALSLAKDELHYKPEQLAALSKQIKLGDLTPVLQLYEEDIKRPLKSAVTGTLLRSVFIQVQKAKVDIDQALTGIDKLLKSQELTFAFVGVAPAFAIVYLLGGSLKALWSGGRGWGKYGGKRRISSVWTSIRRIERLLICQPESRSPGSDFATHPIPPLTTGLLLLSVTNLRTYAETHLPAQSRLREGFLEDVGDLENPDLGRAEKMRVIDRMWRSWGGVLGWSTVGREGGLLR